MKRLLLVLALLPLTGCAMRRPYAVEVNYILENGDAVVTFYRDAHMVAATEYPPHSQQMRDDIRLWKSKGVLVP